MSTLKWRTRSIVVLLFMKSLEPAALPAPKHVHDIKWRFLQKCDDLEDCSWAQNHICREPKPEEIKDLADISMRELKASLPKNTDNVGGSKPEPSVPDAGALNPNSTPSELFSSTDSPGATTDSPGATTDLSLAAISPATASAKVRRDVADSTTASLEDSSSSTDFGDNATTDETELLDATVPSMDDLMGAVDTLEWSNIIQDLTNRDAVPDFSASANVSSGVASPSKEPEIVDDGIIRPGEKRCFCLNGTTLDSKAKLSPSCVSNYAYLNDACGHIAVPNANKPSVCAAEANLQCSDLIPTQFSRCRCRPGAEPNIYSRTCTLPPRIIKIGEACTVNGTQEEVCEGDYSICLNGTCVCDMEDGAVMEDQRHHECYLRINPRHVKQNSAHRLQLVPFKKSHRHMRAWELVLDIITVMLLCFLVNILVFRILFNILF